MLLGCFNYNRLEIKEWLCLLPIGLLGHIYDGFQLCFTNFSCFSRFTLFKGLSDAENNLEACVERGACFDRYHIRGFEEKCTTFGVTWSKKKTSKTIRFHKIMDEWDNGLPRITYGIPSLASCFGLSSNILSTHGWCLSINKLRYLVSPVNAPDSL